MSSSSTPAAVSQKKGPTDYKKWDKFDTKAYGYDSEEEKAELEQRRKAADPRFLEEQQRQYKATMEEMARTKKKIAELEKQQKVAEEVMRNARVRQEWWSTWGIGVLVLIALIAFLVPQIVIYLSKLR